LDELVQWVISNPGRFTYAQPLQSDGKSFDFTGSAFIRHILYYYGAPYTDMLGAFNRPLYNQRASRAFAALRRIEPALAKVNGMSHPTSQGMIDDAFAREEVWITASYQVTFAGRQVAIGKWPNTTMAYVPQSGTIQNTNFIAIAKTTSNLAASLVVANTIADISAMFKRRQPEGWGAIQVYNPTCKAMVDGGWKTAFDYLKYFPQTPSPNDLRNRAMSELDAAYITQMQTDWVTCVVAYPSNVQTVPCI
jgi:putative spermidine/putrescine transport system substrate-binding protein